MLTYQRRALCLSIYLWARLTTEHLVETSVTSPWLTSLTFVGISAHPINDLTAREDSLDDYKMADSSQAQPQTLGEDANTNKECNGGSCSDDKRSSSNLPKATTEDFVPKKSLTYGVY
jgi:hypothetical protein